MDDKEKIIAWYAGFLVALIILITLITFAVFYFEQQQSCIGKAPLNYQCYDDYLCLGENNTEITISKDVFTRMNNCKTLTDVTSESITYTDELGQDQTKTPKFETDIFAVVGDEKNRHQCYYGNPGVDNDCPTYTIGSVYWPACNGQPDSNYYIDPQVAQKLHAESTARRIAARGR